MIRKRKRDNNLKVLYQATVNEMTHTDLEMFMAKMKSLVYETENINPFIEAKRPELQLLYEELVYLIRSCFDETEDAGNFMKRRLVEAAQVAEDTVDMFLSSAIIKSDSEDKLLDGDERLLDCSLKDLKYVMDDLKSIREDIVSSSSSSSSNKGSLFENLVKKDTMMGNKFEATGNTRVNVSATGHEDLIVGFDDFALLMIDRLTGDRKKLDTVPIVGMGGQGKTTLATKIFNHSLVEYHFDKRGWVTVSEAYSKRDVLLQLLMSLGKSVHESGTESKLCEILYQSLKGRRYLIVIDDIWSCKAWDDVGICLPDDKTGSRVLITTRLTEVASHASQGGFTHILPHLNEDQSWELLCKKTFRGHECPESLVETGKRIAKRCGGLPLALVVIAGLLEKAEKSKDLWDKIAKSVGSYIIKDTEGCMDTLALSYDHLPCHLKKCFLYISGFPEDYKVQVRTLIRLWLAEGFIKEAGQRSLEEEGEYYLKDLIDRNLLIVADKSSNGGIKSCRMHDLLRELCLTKASDENFLKKVSMPMSDNTPFSDLVSSIVKQRRLFTDCELLYNRCLHNLATHARSALCFHAYEPPEYRTTSWVSSFLLLRVLDLINIPFFKLDGIEMLVHLRYLAVWLRDCGSLFSWATESPFSKTKFGSLQTLIVKGKFQSISFYPDKMVNLRHLRCDRIDFSIDFCAHSLFHLQTISRLRLDHRAQSLLEYFPNIKKLGCSIFSASTKHGSLSFALLTHLEALNINKYMYDLLTLASPIRFPETLRKLTLSCLRLPWNYMSTIQRLPKLEVLKLLDSSFMGHLWETGDEQFHLLKFLKLEKLNIRFWEASSINFPCLKKLIVKSCDDLKEIPLELGDIYTLEHIEIDYANTSVFESVSRIQETQREIGNNDIHVNFTHKDPSEVYFEGDPFYD